MADGGSRMESDGSCEIEDQGNETEMNLEDANGSKVTNETSKVYLPSQAKENDGPLECDESVYIFYHQARTGAPCLSFDIIEDDLGNDRAEKFPLTMYLVAGTQAEKHHLNNLIIMKMSNIDKSKSKEESDTEDDSDSSSDEDESSMPSLECALVQHLGCVNRLRVTHLEGKPIVASWSELGKVYLWDVSLPFRAVNDEQTMKSYLQKEESPLPIFTFSGHQIEGYAVSWSSVVPGMLATGDCRKNIHLWKPQNNTWHVDQKTYVGHTASVEDIQWSPNESNVMASCSVDKTIRIWDIRASPDKACMLTCQNAHDSDVNVISWNKHDPLILSGSDDGSIKVWDLRKFPDSSAICTFKHHVAPITSVEWHPTDSSAFAASGEDDQLTLWDLAVERDDQAENLSKEILELPPQLLFIHQGQKEIKELHWHLQMPGVLVSTAVSGFNIFRTLSI